MTTKGSDIVKKIRAQQKLKAKQPAKPLNFSKVTNKLKPVTSKVRNVASSGSTKIRNLVTTGSTKFKKTVTPVTSKIKPTLSNIKSGVGDALNTRTGIGLRVKASQLKDIFIDKNRPKGGFPGTKGYLDLGKITKGKGWLPIGYKGGKGFLKKTPIIGHGLNVILASGSFKTERDRLIKLGYRKENAGKIAFIKTLGEHGGYGAGATIGGAVMGAGGSVIPGAGTVAGGFAGATAGGLAGGWLGDKAASLLIRAAGLKKTDAQLQSQLRARKQDEARVNIQSQKLQLSNALGG